MISEALYLNQNKFPSIVKDYSEVKNCANNIMPNQETEKENTNEKSLFNYAIETIPQFRKLDSTAERIDNNDMLGAMGMASVALLSTPEDFRDIKTSFKQIKNGKMFEPAYDYKQCQHPFSFFRGTILSKLAEPFPNFVEKVYNVDKSIAHTEPGKALIRKLNVTRTGLIDTKIQSTKSTKANPECVKAMVYKGSKFGELTARALERCSLLGFAAMALLEVPKIVKAVNESKSVSEKVQNAEKQTVKSAINLATVTTSIAYLGAIGAKHFGPTGSLLGIGLGATLGNVVSKPVQGLLD